MDQSVPPVEVGGTTLHRMVLEAAGRFGDRPALVDGPSGTAVSYRRLAERVLGVAAGLAARGFRPGDVLALWAPNLPQWAGVALGAMAAGGTVTAASPAGSERELATQLADARASVLVTLAVPLCAGATVVTMPRFDPGDSWSWSSATGCRCSSAPRRCCGC